MRIRQHLFIPCFWRTTCIEQESCRRDELNFVCSFIRSIHKLIIDWGSIILVISFLFFLIRRIPNNVVELHLLAFLLDTPVSNNRFIIPISNNGFTTAIVFLGLLVIEEPRE